MLRFNDIADRMLEYNPGVDLELLQRAYVFSAMVHEGQERLSGEPYLIHPLEVAGILVDLRLDDVAVAAGLLHDTLEDTLTTREELEKNFGEKVAFLVEGLTKIAKIEFRSDRERQAENFRKMLVAMSTDIRILLIKLSDRLHNMRTLGFMKEASRRRIAQETMDIYVPLAHRLGIYWMKQELEELSFRALHPDMAEELEKRISDLRDEREAYIGEVISALTSTLEEAGLQAELSGRLKELSSIHKKMESQSLEFDQIHDVIAFRVILEGDIGACYAALGLVHSMWRPVPGRFKDYIALPKQNGYQSLHTTVIGPYGERMEVQLRTRSMHREAELGIAAHWKYKEGRIQEEGDDSKFAWLRQLLEFQQLADPHEFLETVKLDLFPDEVFVFTPQGDVINLPTGATPIDFAYAIHSEVGHHCSGAKVNGKQVALRHVLRDGDTVEVSQRPSQHPKKEWLDFVVSSRARNRIRHDLRQAERARSCELGREILERELRKANLSFARLEKSGELARLAASELKDGQLDGLYAAIGYGKLAAPGLVAKLAGEPAADEAQSTARDAANMAERAIRGLMRRARRSGSSNRGSGIRVGGESDVMVRFGNCCTPLPGDEVVGFVTRGRGVTVHRKDCEHVFRIDPERRIDVDWDEASPVPRSVRIRVHTKDERGILAAVTNTISSAGIDIGDTLVKTGEDKQAVQTFALWVTDRQALDDVIREIRRIRGVSSVERTAE